MPGIRAIPLDIYKVKNNIISDKFVPFEKSNSPANDAN